MREPALNLIRTRVRYTRTADQERVEPNSGVDSRHVFIPSPFASRLEYKGLQRWVEVASEVNVADCLRTGGDYKKGQIEEIRGSNSDSYGPERITSGTQFQYRPRLRAMGSRGVLPHRVT